MPYDGFRDRRDAEAARRARRGRTADALVDAVASITSARRAEAADGGVVVHVPEDEASLAAGAARERGFEVGGSARLGDGLVRVVFERPGAGRSRGGP
jgi:hypothetical protein